MGEANPSDISESCELFQGTPVEEVMGGAWSKLCVEFIDFARSTGFREATNLSSSFVDGLFRSTSLERRPIRGYGIGCYLKWVEPTPVVIPDGRPDMVLVSHYTYSEGETWEPEPPESGRFQPGSENAQNVFLCEDGTLRLSIARGSKPSPEVIRLVPPEEGIAITIDDARALKNTALMSAPGTGSIGRMEKGHEPRKYGWNTTAMIYGDDALEAGTAKEYVVADLEYDYVYFIKQGLEEVLKGHEAAMRPQSSPEEQPSKRSKRTLHFTADGLRSRRS